MTGDEGNFRTIATDTAIDRAALAFQVVATWVFGTPLAELLAALGKSSPTGRPSPEADPSGWLHLDEELPEWLGPVLDAGTDAEGLSAAQIEVLRKTLAVERAAAAKFNFRAQGGERYRERSQAVTADFDPGLRAQVLRLTDKLGLVSPSPTKFDRYDMTLVLGGSYLSPLLRARYAAQLQSAGVDLGQVSFLGSPRFLIQDPPERPAAEEYAPGAIDEFDLMRCAALAEFGLVPDKITFLCGCASADSLCPAWQGYDDAAAWRTPPAYTHERRADLVDRDGRAVGSVLSASTGRPPYRPDTSDTFALWARCFEPRPGQRVLVVTTQVFVPFQSFDGFRQLRLIHGVEVDTVGFGPEWGDRPNTAEYLLQETLSAIRSGRRLLVDAAEVLRHGNLPG